MRPYRAHLTAFLAVLCLSSAAALPAAAANFTVITNSDNTFSPDTLTITAGDTVTFQNASQGFHDVDADDNSFRCANGCDGKGGDGSPSTAPWSVQLAFDTPGTFPYHCVIHGAPGVGMHGTITVNPKAGSPGSLSFTKSAFGAAENAGTATIAVQRTGGTAGAVSTHFATADGTAVAGTNYRASSGTLNWSDGDASTKTFDVPVLDDRVSDGSHTVNLTLTAPTGGATLALSSAALTITNTDGAAKPAAPTGLAATPIDGTHVSLTWTLAASSGATDVRVQSRVLDGGAFADVLPLLPASTNHLVVPGLQPATSYGFHVRAENGNGVSPYTPEVDVATAAPAGPCVADANTLCLGAGGRFKATVSWLAADGQKGAGSAVPLASNPDSGLFYFFNQGNIEMLIKVLNACAPPFNAYWVFFAATTNVEFTVTVVDTQSSRTKVYTNPLNQAAAPVQDTAAFLTCP